MKTMKRITFIFVLLCATISWAATPTLVQDVVWGSDAGGMTNRYWYFHLPQGTRGGSSTQGDTSNNLLVCTVGYDTTSITVAITDDLTNTWTAGPTTNDGGHNVKMYYAAGAKQGTQNLVVTTSALTTNLWFRCSEFYNVATTSPSDGSAVTVLGSGKAAPTVSTSAAITTTVDNDLIYYAGMNGNSLCCVATLTNWTVGTSFNLLGSDRRLNHFAEYRVQTTFGAITPSITATGSTDTFDAVAQAFKAATAGTAPTGIRIVHEYTTTPGVTSDVVQFPCSGNLFVATGSTAPAQANITDIVDSDANGSGTTNGSVDRGAGHWDRLSSTGNPQIVYAQNATCTNPNTRTVTITLNSVGVPDPVMLYDIVGAAASAFDATMGVVTCTGNQVSKAASDTTCANNANYNSTCNATPSTAKGILIVVENNGQGPECGTSSTNNVADMAWFQLMDDACCGLLNSSSGYAHIPYSSAVQQTITFNWANSAAGGPSGWSIAMAAFKEASVAVAHSGHAVAF